MAAWHGADKGNTEHPDPEGSRWLAHHGLAVRHGRDRTAQGAELKVSLASEGSDGRLAVAALPDPDKENPAAPRLGRQASEDCFLYCKFICVKRPKCVG